MTAPGELFEMDEADIRGVRTRVWKHAPGTLRDILEMSRGYGDAPFLVYGDDRVGSPSTTRGRRRSRACWPAGSGW